MPIDAAALIARFLLAVVFIPNGIMKLSDIAGTAGYFESLGFPAPTLVAWGSGIFELAAGLAIVAGFQTRIAALLLSAFCVATALLGHIGQGGDDATLAFMHMQAFLKDVGLSGGFLALALTGPGRFSMDGARD